MHVSTRLAGIAVGAALAALATPARACSVCGCGDPMLAAGDPAASSGRLRLGLDGEYLAMTSGAPSDALDQYTLRLSAVGALGPSVGVMAVLPLTRKDLRNADGTGSDLSGLGDAELAVRVTVLDRVQLAARARQSLALSLGTSLPTGLRAATWNGHPVDEHGQPGTGAWGPYAGLHARVERAAWTLLADASARLRTVNAEGYQYGNALLWSLHGQLWASDRLALDLGLDGRWAAADAQGGAAVEDTGGVVLAAAPGAYWNAAGPLWLALRAQVPFLTDLQGVQTVGPTVTFGVQYLAL